MLAFRSSGVTVIQRSRYPGIPGFQGVQIEKAYIQNRKTMNVQVKDF